MSGIIEAITKAVQAGLDKDWATMALALQKHLLKALTQFQAYLVNLKYNK